MHVARNNYHNIFDTIFVSSHGMYPENPEGRGTQVMIIIFCNKELNWITLIVGSMNMGYDISDIARNQTHSLFRPY